MTTTAPAAAAPGRVRPLRRAPALAAGLVVGLVLLGVLAVVSVGVGARQVAPLDAWHALTAFDPTSFDHAAVRSRVPRTVVALVVGAALGLAGTLMQGLTRNPLGDPGILGINAGASAAVVLGIFVAGVSDPRGYVWFAFVGAAAAAVVVHVVASAGREGATPVKLALAGACVAAALTSLVAAVLVTRTDALDTFRFWQVGSVGGRDLGQVAELAPFLVVGAVLALASGRMLDAAALGDDVARGLGQHVGRTRVIVGAAVVLLCGAATALAGPIAFVGLVVPHVGRALTGPDHRWLLPYSALLGAALLVVSDVLGRVVAAPGQLEVGLVTAVVGAPVFVALVRRRRLAEL
ncbi:FecCD family ABC transporter permease [Sanguibacter massiliensis]|uniref:FecCD family ABC transporter permease n=1 Tax=Sanguibacter massiliensis TaxID=1973217 RepID=UPI000C856378|nr:iron ABC transporter permease [Sanguibacter massiliensis]